jgi:hypothetical protein
MEDFNQFYARRWRKTEKMENGKMGIAAMTS